MRLTIQIVRSLYLANTLESYTLKLIPWKQLQLPKVTILWNQLDLVGKVRISEVLYLQFRVCGHVCAGRGRRGNGNDILRK